MSRTTLPPVKLRKCGNFFHRDDYWIGSAMREAERLRDLAWLGDGARILDIGCGVGRLCVGLLETGFRFKSYTGLDVEQVAIDWCQRNLARPAVSFEHIDAFNAKYNPHGAVKLDESFRLPFADGSFTVVYLWSVFTHMRLADVQLYLREIKRVLAPDGNVFFTAFCEPGVPDETDSPANYPPRYGKEDLGVLARVRISTDAMFKAVREAGLAVRTFNAHAEWNYQSTFHLAHDDR